jgi:hypothetical protein
MQRFVAILVVWGLSAASVWGGEAIFTDVQNHVPSGTPVVLNVTVAAGSLGNIDAVDLMIGWNRAQDLGFTYSAAFTAAMTTNLTPPVYDLGLYTNDVFVGGADVGGIGATSILVGSVTLQTDGLVVGAYPVMISSDVSALSFEGTTEGVLGTGMVYIDVPEPAGLSLLALGSLLTLRRGR